MRGGIQLREKWNLGAPVRCTTWRLDNVAKVVNHLHSKEEIMKGYMRKRSTNTWQLIYELSRGADGKRRQGRQTVHGTKSNAAAKLREILTSLDRGDYVMPTNETMSAVIRRWLDTYVSTNTSPRTQEDYRGIVRQYLDPGLGNIQLKSLKPEHIQRHYAHLREKGLSAQTVLRSHRVLKQALAHAVKWQVISRNPCEAVDAPKPLRKELLSASEGSKYRDVFLVGLHTGLRRSEILGLKWNSVDLDQGVVRVVAGLHRLPKRGLVLLPTKTNRSRRQLPISPEIVDVFHRIRGEQMVNEMELGPAWEHAGFVFTRLDGRPLDPVKVTKEFTRVIRKLGLGRVRFHDLRHTHASLMLQAGIHPKIVSERLGHASVSITMDVYSHVLPGLQEEAVHRFSKLLTDARSG